VANLQAQQSQQTVAPEPTLDDDMAQIQKLGQMKDAGLLTDEEFASAKAKILGI